MYSITLLPIWTEEADAVGVDLSGTVSVSVTVLEPISVVPE